MVKYQNKTFQKTCFVVGVLFFGLFGVQVQTTQAASIWGTDAIWEMFNINYQDILAQIQGALVGAARSAAAKIMQKQIFLQIGGGRGGQPFIITNFRTTLVTDPTQLAKGTLNDFLRSGSSGRSSQLNYTSVSDFGTSLGNLFLGGGSTSSSGIRFANSTTGSGISTRASELPTVTSSTVYDGAQKYVKNIGSVDCATDTASLSSTTGLGLLSAVTQPGSGNTPITKGACAANLYYSTLATNQDIARTQAISPGFAAKTDSNGNITTPARSIGDLIDAAVKLPNNIAGSAKNVAEFVASAAGTLASSALDSLINQGIAKVTSTVNQATGGVVSLSVSNSPTGVGYGLSSGGSSSSSSFGGSGVLSGGSSGSSSPRAQCERSGTTKFCAVDGSCRVAATSSEGCPVCCSGTAR